MENPKISVIIPVYNREKYIKNCLEIITNQTYKNLEIIVVNDGSSDNSVNIINTFEADKRINLIHHEKNQGLSAARNTGIDNATGKYIHFMDDDDEVNPKFYEYLLKASEENNADMSVCSFIINRRLSSSQEFSKTHIAEDTVTKFKLTNMLVHGYVCRYLFKADFLKKHALKFEIGRFCEDGIFSFMSVYYANKIVSVPKSYYYYINNPNSITNKKETKHLAKKEKDHNYGQKLISDFASKHNLDLTQLKKSKFQDKTNEIFYGVKKFFKTFNFGYLKF